MTDFSITVHDTIQPNIGNDIDDQTSIALTLFNIILEKTNTRAELEHSWEVIRDISIRERWEARQRKPRNQ